MSALGFMDLVSKGVDKAISFADAKAKRDDQRRNNDLAFKNKQVALKDRQLSNEQRQAELDRYKNKKDYTPYYVGAGVLLFGGLIIALVRK